MRWLAVTAMVVLAGCNPEAPPRQSGDTGGGTVNDVDGDGFSSAQGDCNDNDARTFPGAWDAAGDGVDQNCDQVDGVDADSDGQASAASGGADCNDDDPTVFTGAEEIGWDLIDQDCDLTDQHDFTQICAGNKHTCAIDTTGRIRCWGVLDERTLNIPPADPKVFPNDGSPWTSLSCGYDTTCAVSESGSMYCWGLEDERDGLMLTAAQPYEDMGKVWDRVFLGHYHGCVVDATGRASCFGLDEWGQVSKVPGSALFKEMGLGNDHTCGIYGSQSIIECWGNNTQDIRIESDAPDPATSQGWLQITAGDSFACGIRSDLGRDCWGDNDRLDNDMPTNEAGPWGLLSAKGPFVCGIKELEPECRGKLSPFGVLDNTPTEVDMRFIAGGIDHACGLRQSDGEPVCWGRDSDGQSTIPEWPNR